MYVGQIEKNTKPKFYHANTDIPFDPAVTDSGCIWESGVIFCSEVDIKYSFEKEVYVGEIAHGISGAAEISVIVDGQKVAVKDMTSPVYVNLSGIEVIIRARGNLADLKFGGAKIYGFYPDDAEPLLFPLPKTYKTAGKNVKIGNITAEGEDGLFAKDFLIDSLQERLEQVPTGDGVTLRFEVCNEYEDERYSINVDADGACVKGGSKLALMWGACRVIDLWDGGYLPCLEIDDKPDVPMRGFHMGLPSRENFAFFKKLIRYVLLPLGYNHVILEFNGDMRYDRHPEITESWLETERLSREGKGERAMHADIGAQGTALEKDEVREIVAAIECYGIEVVPEVQSLSHVQHITAAHPEFSELGKYFAAKLGSNDSIKSSDSYVPEIPDADEFGINHTNIPEHCYCPSDEACMQLIFDIIDEVVEVVKPRRYVHIGHDEVYHVGLCPECRKKGGPRIYIEHVKALHDHLANKGLKTMLWSDMFHTDIYYAGEDYAILKEELPKDLMLIDFIWYYQFGKDIEDDILPSGYEIMIGNLYSSHYPRFASRIAKPGMVGGEVSTWTAVSEDKFALNGKFFDLPYTAEALWNAYSYDENNRASLSALIGQCIIPEMRDLMHGCFDLYLRTDENHSDLIGNFEGDDTRIPDELSYLGLTEPKDALAVAGKYSRLIFEHTTLNPAPRICWHDLIPVGKYTITYADGEKADIPVSYAGGILCYNSHFGQPMPQQYYRHQGYVGTWFADPTYEYRTSEGTPILLLGQIWDNPRPDTEIASISYTPDKNDTAVLLSAGVTGIK